VIGMITPRQSKAARSLLGWTQKDLAEEAKINLAVVTRFERNEVDTRGKALIAIEKAIRRGGIDLIYADDRKGEGVRLASAKG
jgi:ribosome-binding protein aMBF1 (putative translation factor)